MPATSQPNAEIERHAGKLLGSEKGCEVGCSSPPILDRELLPRKCRMIPLWDSLIRVLRRHDRNRQKRKNNAIAEPNFPFFDNRVSEAVWARRIGYEFKASGEFVTVPVSAPVDAINDVSNIWSSAAFGLRPSPASVWLRGQSLGRPWGRRSRSSHGEDE